MENQKHGGKQDKLAEHSLPGTNQAGKDVPQVNTTTKKPDQGKGGPQLPDQLEEHSLPGTNQAGKDLPHVNKTTDA
jgi:hypothetical protein